VKSLWRVLEGGKEGSKITGGNRNEGGLGDEKQFASRHSEQNSREDWGGKFEGRKELKDKKVLNRHYLSCPWKAILGQTNKKNERGAWEVAA